MDKMIFQTEKIGLELEDQAQPGLAPVVGLGQDSEHGWEGQVGLRECVQMVLRLGVTWVA